MAFKKKTTKKAEVEAQAAVAAVSGLEVSGVISEIGTLQVDLQKTLADISATITNKLAQVEQIDKAIDLKKNELQDLYNIEKEAMSLEDLKAQKELEEDAWNKHVEAQELAQSEKVSEREKMWQREDEEHEYAVKRRNERAEEDYRVLVDRHQRDERIRMEQLQRGWNDREAALKSQENDVAQLRQQVAEFDARLKAEAGKAEAIATNRLTKQHEQEMLIAKKDMEAMKQLHIAEVKGLDNTISSLSERIDRLERELDRARTDAKEVTSQALAATSDRKVAEALHKVVDSQSQPSGKK